MHYTFSFLLFIGFSLSSCSKISAPACIKNKIKTFEKEACQNGANVEQYLFQSKSVFVFNPGNCGADMPAFVLDSNCVSLGFLGGIMGNTKINGEDFSNAQRIKITWKK